MDCRSLLPRYLFLLLSASILVLVNGTAIAQEAPAPRFELAHESGDQGFTTVPMKENGLALIREKQKTDGNKRTWQILLLDSALRTTWNTDVVLESWLTLVGFDYTNGELFFLFRKGESDYNDLQLLRIYSFSHTIQQYTITPKLDFRLTHFIVVDNSAVFGGYVTRQPAVLLYDMATERVKFVPGFFIDNTELLELKANRNSSFNALLVERGRREKKMLLLKTFDTSGSVLLEDAIEIDDDRTILSGTTSSLDSDDLLLAGVWGTSGPNYRLASGLFSVLVDPFNKQPIQYKEFTELNHFLDYLSKKKAAKTKNKAERRRKSHKAPTYRINVNVVRMEDTAKGFGLLCELYNQSLSSNYPYYNNNPYSPYSSSNYNPYYYGSPYMYNPMTMNRYYNSPYNPNGNLAPAGEVTVVNASLILFDKLGIVKEDYSFPLKSIKIPHIEQVSDFLVSDKFVQFYKKESDLLVNTQDEFTSQPSTDTIKIELKSSDDVVRKESEDQGGVRYWFGPFGYAWGYETIKNKSGSLGDPVRYVYYINKVRLD